MTLIVAAVILRLPCPLGLEARLTPTAPTNVVPLLRPRKDVTVGSSWKVARAAFV